MPCINHNVVTSNTNHNGLVYISEGGDNMKVLNRNAIGLPMTLESLLALNTFNFQIVKNEGTAIADADIGSAFWLNMVFYQDE